MTCLKKIFRGLFLSSIIFILSTITSAQENQTGENSAKSVDLIISLLSANFNLILIILALFLGPYFALRQYDTILLNKKRYEVFKDVWEIKTKYFGNLINELYVMSDVVHDLHELSDINVKNPKSFDSSILLGYINLIEMRDGKKIISEEIVSTLTNWALLREEIKEKDQFEAIYKKLINYRRFHAHVAFLRISKFRQILNLYIQNGKMLSELAEIARKVLDACNKNYSPKDDMNQFAEWFSNDLSLVMRQMKDELQKTIDSNRVDLTVTKSSLDAPVYKYTEPADRRQ